jgi:zinc/manganese transport system substrate-binding protein
MKKLFICLIFAWALSGPASATIHVAASMPDIASIASYIGGDRVDVFSIARSTSDPHAVEVLPAYMVRVSRADLYLKSGLSLDQWADQIIDGSRNSHLKVVDCSVGIAVLDKPSGKVTAAMGDVHPDGNPHYWLDPANGLIIAQTIADALTVADGAGASQYAANLERFKNEVHGKLEEWERETAAMKKRNIISYHSSWVYFAHAFGFNTVANIEPVPGIPPTAGHLAKLIQLIREHDVSIAIQEPYFADDAANYLARETKIKVLKLAPSCAGCGPLDYLNHFEQIIAAIRQAAGA